MRLSSHALEISRSHRYKRTHTYTRTVNHAFNEEKEVLSTCQLEGRWRALCILCFFLSRSWPVLLMILRIMFNWFLFRFVLFLFFYWRASSLMPVTISQLLIHSNFFILPDSPTAVSFFSLTVGANIFYSPPDNIIQCTSKLWKIQIVFGFAFLFYFIFYDTLQYSFTLRRLTTLWHILQTGRRG